MKKQQIKVLFLTRYPYMGASSRYRVYQYISHLETLGVTCCVDSFMDDDMYHLSFKPGRTFKKIWATLKASINRIKQLSHYKSYNIIYMQRELFPFGPPLIERWMKKRGAILFFDYDDALFIKKPSRYNPIATFLRSPEKVLRLFSLVDCVVAGNDWLRDAATDHGGRAITIEVAEDTDRIKMHALHTNESPVTIGWLGSSSTVKYLRFIEPALRNIALSYPEVRFEIVGGGDFEMQGVSWKLNEWSLEGELKALACFDIGLMPLPMENWAKGKSGGKARTYMAAGVVPICSNIGYNKELIRNGQTGYLCLSNDEWFDSLSRLIEDANLRQNIATAARADVKERFSLNKQALRLKNIFEEVILDNKADTDKITR